jgi:anti-sigma regulatory factor (Ser/Thr protein kinase)
MRDGFEHEALFYRGEDGFVGAVLPRLREALAHDAAVLVAVDAPKGARLREALGPDAGRIELADMRALGGNPGRIIPVWRRFVEGALTCGRPAYGIGEPVWPGRSEDELGECHRHECLLNAAFAGGPPWWLGCPYDVAALAPSVVEGARHSHPLVAERGRVRPSPVYDACAPLPAEALTPAPAETAQLDFGAGTVPAVRRFTAELAALAGLDGRPTADLVLAVHELATNSVRHGGGTGTVLGWLEPGQLVCEVRDAGVVGDPLVGRAAPDPLQVGGRGLWLVHQLCDLVQLRSGTRGTTVRVRVAAPGPAATA